MGIQVPKMPMRREEWNERSVIYPADREAERILIEARRKEMKKVRREEWLFSFLVFTLFFLCVLGISVVLNGCSSNKIPTPPQGPVIEIPEEKPPPGVQDIPCRFGIMGEMEGCVAPCGCEFAGEDFELVVCEHGMWRLDP